MYERETHRQTDAKTPHDGIGHTILVFQYQMEWWYSNGNPPNGGVECKKPQRYAKDNRTAHLTARSDKSLACVTNNKRLLDVLYCWS